MSHNRQKGEKGEQAAVDFLIAQGYEILERNFFYSHAELDVICRHKQEIVFVEVKSRFTPEHGDPEDFVNRRKQMLIAKAAEAWLMMRQWEEKPSRFDVVTIDFTVNPPSIRHYVDAFIIGWN